jgi:hypothetical protein
MKDVDGKRMNPERLDVDQLWKKKFSLYPNEKGELEEIPDQYTLSRPSREAGPGVVMDNAIQIRAHFNYNGSGPSFFGGAKKWPVITVHFPLPEDWIEIRDHLVTRFADFCEELQSEFDLLSKDTT